MPANRPFLRSTIFDLNAIYEARLSDAVALKSLAAELTFRNTPKAKELERKVQQALDRMSCSLPFRNGPIQQELHLEAPVPNINSNASHGSTPVPDPPIEDLGPLPSFRLPTGPDESLGILAAWTALEALSPQTYRKPEDLAADRHCVADLTGGAVPWKPRELSRRNKQLYYQVMLGAIPMDCATDELIKAFGEDEERSRREREKAVIAAILVDRDGNVLESDAIAVSSFAWALPMALQLKLQSLGAWSKIERIIQDRLEKIVRRFDDDGRPIPLDLATIHRAYAWLVKQFHLPAHLVEPPSFALRIYHYYRSKSPPEASLLNSFFLTDLASAASLVEAKRCGAGLRRYLGIEKAANAQNIFPPSQSVEPFVTPRVIPSVRWPLSGGHPLVLLQQAAVNAARTELGGVPGIIAVNGPPGTGKTTLLRDLVAACVLDRAAVMARFDDPNAAFSTTGQRMAVGENAFFHFYRLNASLRGHEILVASSNNKAVENVSLELPVKKACGRDFGYFPSISDIVANPRRFGASEDEAETPENEIETWGLIAAALGNAKNRFLFQQSFWWHENGFRIYLKAAKGDSVVIEIKDDGGRIIERKTPQVILDEKPPESASAANAAWAKARRRFLALKAEIEAELQALELARQECLRLPEAERQLRLLEAQQAPAVAAVEALSETHRRRLTEEKAFEAALQRRADFRAKHRLGKPGFFSRLFGTSAWHVWRTEDERLATAVHSAQRDLEAAERALNDAAAELRDAAERLRTLDDRLGKERAALQARREAVVKIRCRLGDRVLDASFLPGPMMRSRLRCLGCPTACTESVKTCSRPHLLCTRPLSTQRRRRSCITSAF